MRKKILTWALLGMLVPGFSANAAEAITEIWKTAQKPLFGGDWGSAAPDWTNPNAIKTGSNPRFATVSDGKIFTIDQKTMSIAEVTKEGELVPTYVLPQPANAADFYGTAIAADEVGNFLIGMNFTQRPTSSTKFAIYNAATKTCKEFNLEVPEGWTVGRLDCMGRVLGDLTKEAIFTIVPETGYTSEVRIIEVKGEGTLESVTFTDLGNVPVAGNYTQQNIAVPAYHTMAEAKAADAVNDFYYSSCNGTNNYYASYVGGKVTGDFAPDMLYTTVASNNGFETFVVDGKRYFIRNYAKTAKDRLMSIVVMDENGDLLATWEDDTYTPDGGYSTIYANVLANKTVDIYVYNSGNKIGGEAALLNFDPAAAGEPIAPEIPVGTAENPYQINTVEDLTGMAAKIATGTFYVTLEADLDMTDVAFTPIASKSTIYFDGKNHTISNLTITGDRASIFGDFIGTIKNLGVVNCKATATGWGTGATIVGYASGADVVVENCFASGDVVGFYAGGLVAGVNTNAKATIRNCYSSVNVTSTNGYSGGVAGPCNEGATIVIENSYAAGAVAGIHGGGISAGMNTAYASAAIVLNNVAVFCPTVTGTVANAIYVPNDKLSNTVNNAYVSDATTVNGAAVAGAVAETTIVKEVMTWEGFNSTEVNETTNLPILAWQSGKPFDTSAVAEIEVNEDVPAVYYNLQGVRIANPENGVYIVRRGDKVTKELVK